MGWMDCYQEIKTLIDSDEFKEMNKTCNPNDPETGIPGDILKEIL